MSMSEIQVVTFGLDDEVFAVPVALVREILDYREPFHVPNGPAHFVGLTDVRGQGVPTVDFRLRIGLAATEPTLATRIIILDIPLSDRTLSLGVVIDRVLGVSAFPTDRIEKAPDIGIGWRSDYITGVIREEAGFVVIVDVAHIFTTDESVNAAQDVARVA